MPEFGYLHDDGLFFVTAKSVAEGGYKIESLPETPAQTKFPPLYPLYLSLIWRIDPRFPANLALATGFCFAAFAACMVLAWVEYRQEFSEPRAWLLTALLAVNPYLVLFGCRMFSEVFFTCWVLAVFLALRRPGIKMALLAGIFAACAYLSRTAGIALLISVPAVLILKKESRRAVAFAAAMLPAILGWMMWARAHAIRSTDSTLTYYTDYLRYEFLNVNFANLGVVLWKNTDQVLWGMGSLILPKIFYLGPVKILTQVIAVAMIAGIVRLVRRGSCVQYAAFALVSTGILLVWHFPPNERFVLPVYPLLLAGLVVELAHLAGGVKAAFQRKDAGQKIVGAAFASGVAAVFGIALAMQIYGTFVYVREAALQKEAKLRELRTAYAWIDANLPPSATFLSYDDPLMYLYTGHRGNYLPLLPRWWYSEDYSSMVGAYGDLPDYCHGRGLQYVYFSSNDLDRELGDDLREKVQQTVGNEAGLTPIHKTPLGEIYKVENQASARR